MLLFDLGLMLKRLSEGRRRAWHATEQHLPCCWQWVLLRLMHRPPVNSQTAAARVLLLLLTTFIFYPDCTRIGYRKLLPVRKLMLHNRRIFSCLNTTTHVCDLEWQSSGGSKNFERGGRQFISSVFIYRKCAQRNICLLHGKSGFLEKNMSQ